MIFVLSKHARAEAEAEQKMKELEQLEASIEGAEVLGLAGDKNRKMSMNRFRQSFS